MTVPPDPTKILVELDTLKRFEEAIRETAPAGPLLDYLHGARQALLWAAGQPVSAPSKYLLDTVGKVAAEKNKA